MRIQYPSSFLRLLLAGFAFAVLPLLWVFSNSNIAFDNLAKQSQQTISNSVATTRAGRELQEQLSLMERSSKQYFVLQDEVLFKHYLQAYSNFKEAIQQLNNLANTPSQHKSLQILSEKIFQLNESINKAKQFDVSALGFMSDFSQITQHVDAIVHENGIAIDHASNQLIQNAQRTQKKLFLQSLVLIPLALFIAAVITYLLARPIRRMDDAIKNLGEGHYDKPIMIDGPGDLKRLGHRLDWLRSELKDLNEQKQQFLRHVSHELKTPLTAIREAAELLNDGIGGKLSVQQSEITHILLENSIRLQKMIENLLNYTRAESQLNLANVKLSDTINKVVQAHALSIQNKKLTIETVCHIENIVADADKLTTILDNLISNAVKYTPNLGAIHIHTKLDRKNWIIEVRDTGPGFSKDDRDKLFDPFYRGNAVSKSLINSSGLGLTITKDLVEAHGGSIELKSSTQGAIIVISIPQTEFK